MTSFPPRINLQVPDKRIIVYFETRQKNFGSFMPRKQKFIPDEICCPAYGTRCERLSYMRAADQCTAIDDKSKVKFTGGSGGNN